jgi:hypothetical protein
MLGHFIVVEFQRYLRLISRVPMKRRKRDESVPPCVVGTFERMLAFVLVAFAVTDTALFLTGWIGAKLASNWQRHPIGGKTVTREEERTIRAQSFIALLTGTMSLGFGALGGFIARSAFHWAG